MNQYNALALKGPVASASAQLADGGVYGFDWASKTITGKTCPVYQLAGGSHPSGGTLYIAGDPDDVAGDDTASCVLYAIKLLGQDKCLVHQLTLAATITFGTGTLALGISALADTLRYADSVGTHTPTGYGASLSDAFQTFDPREYSPGGNGIGNVLLPSLPGMWGLAVDLYGAADDDLYTLFDSHT